MESNELVTTAEERELLGSMVDMTLEHKEMTPDFRRQLSVAEATSAFINHCNSPAEQSTDEQISLVEQL